MIKTGNPLNNLIAILNTATKDKPVTRLQLISRFGVSDRAARKMIEGLRERGMRVCGTADGKGYWIAKSEAEYKAFRAEYVSKATTILRRTSKMDAQASGQMEIDV